MITWTGSQTSGREIRGQKAATAPLPGVAGLRFT
jgi:hypothetical protein